ELIPAIWPLKAIEMVRQFRVAGQKVSFTIAPGHPDASYVERHVEEYRRFADLIDTVIATEGELQMITGRDDWEGMMKYFHERGVEHVAVNQGKEGAVIWSRDGGLESVKAPRVRFVDIDGAGESFAAGFLAGIAKGFTPKDAGRMACTAAGLCVRARGALEGTKDPELVERAFKDIETSRQAALA
ncbi:MAG: carbohydrate kinase family protein, partial [Planctomycetota bacterium]